ncbi:MAG TPA: autotransporter-associated beta strand repeat-containing protein, partial [Thermoguttaceae bacterium]|nr:autotransporter-associated beta strand repeat-containing protein [Thermoguttaceae bacterium]
MFTCSAHPKKNPFGREEVFRFGFLTAKRLGLAVALLAAIAPASAWAQTVYTWYGSVSSDFSNSANWKNNQVAPTGTNGGNPWNARITVGDGSNTPVFPLYYTSAQGYTLYAASGGGTSDRSLFIATGTNGAMEIQGGTFESRAVGADGMANAATGSLTINGGAYINTEGTGARTFLVIHGGGGSGTLTIQSGTFAVHTLKFGDSSTSTGTGYVYLNGGLLSVGTIVDSGNAVSYVYLNGGTLQARAETTTFLNNLDNVYVSTGGAIIDTQSYSVTIPVVLKHDPAGSSPDGGLTKKGAGGLILSAANTYTGTTTVETGILKISHSQALGATDGGTVVNQGAQLALSGGITVTGEALTLYGQGPGNVHGLFAAGGGTNTWDGPITLAAANARIGAGSGQTLVVSGPISDGGSGYNLVIRNTGGETILKGASTYTGATRVFVGTVKIDGGDNRLPTGSVLQIGNTSNVDWATFDLNGYNQQVAGLDSEGTTMTMIVTNSSATASTLTIQNTADYSYSGLITGNLSLVKKGTATQTLSGSSANTYTGTTTVQDGRLHLSKSSSVNAIGGDLVISGG